MSNPNTPNLPGAIDTLEFVKNLWGGMGIPGANVGGMATPAMRLTEMATPTLSVEEIRKRIADLKAVENWLTVNMNMLRSTIQALEVQAATLATLQSMGNAFAATMAPGIGRETVPVGGAAAGYHGAGGNGQAQPQEAQEAAQTTPGPLPSPDLGAPLANAAAWWGMLQNQFAQAMQQALTGEAHGTDAAAGKGTSRGEAPAGGAGAPRKRKPAK